MYDIEVSEGKIMEIKFTDFDLERECHRDHCPMNNQCKWDLVMVHDGKDDDGDGVGDDILLPKTCNDNVPVSFTSKSYKVQVHFKTDKSVQKKGWRLVFTEI